MDRTPYDQASEDAYGQQSGAFPPVAQSADGSQYAAMSEQEYGDTPPEDNAPPADWREQLEAERQARQQAEGRTREFDRLIHMSRQEYERQQELQLEQQWTTFQNQIPDLTPEQIRQTNNWFMAKRKEREQQARQRAQQVEERTLLGDWKQHVAQQHGLNAENRRRLERYAFANPDQYRDYAQELADQQRRDAENDARFRALETEREAQAHIASGVHRVGGAGSGGPLSRVPQPGDPGYADYAYESTPWTVSRTR